jgi:hypothetical protein
MTPHRWSPADDDLPQALKVCARHNKLIIGINDDDVRQMVKTSWPERIQPN